eukprot:g2916.t1
MPPGGPESQASETGPGDTILRHLPADSSLSRYNTIVIDVKTVLNNLYQVQLTKIKSAIQRRRPVHINLCP